VSAFGDDNSSDTGDTWIVMAGSGKPYQFWQREGQVLHYDHHSVHVMPLDD